MFSPGLKLALLTMVELKDTHTHNAPTLLCCCLVTLSCQIVASDLIM